MDFLLYFLVFLILLTALYGSLSAAPWLPTRKKDVNRFMALAAVKAGDAVYDLGCGDGRLVLAAAKLGAKAIGIEIFVLPYLVAKIRSFFQPGSKILFGDLFRQNLAEADAIFIFLLSKSYGRLLKKFERELKPGARVIISCWPIEAWQDKLVKIDKPTEKDLTIYVYQN